jgi:N6-adenosine-specific RNA methylase IME4
MKFDCIVIDPPWQYRNKNTGGTLISGSDKKYPTLSFEELVNLSIRIKEVSKKDCIIFLWVTNPFLREGLDLLNYYGFEYKTLITWVKSLSSKGMGYWYRGNTEHMILGTKGKIKAFHSQQINVFHAETRQHSQKPIKAYELIEDATRTIKNCKTLEIFARKQYKDWTCIGYDIDKLNVFKSLLQIAEK